MNFSVVFFYYSNHKRWYRILFPMPKQIFGGKAAQSWYVVTANHKLKNNKLERKRILHENHGILREGEG